MDEPTPSPTEPTQPPSRRRGRRLGARRARWAVPALVVAGTVGAVVLVPVVGASAAPALPDRSAGQILASMAAAGSVPLSGTVVETSRLGLPALPDMGGSSISLTSLLTGSHQARVWSDGRDRTRIALVGSLAETDVIRNGSDLWLWTSGKNTAQHLTAPASTSERAAKPRAATSAESLTPQAAADQALAAISPTTLVTIGRTAKVARRSAYELVLEPKQTGSLVRQVRVAVDSTTWVPLRVQVYGAGAAPAFQTTFTAVRFHTPEAAQFRFRPPPGAKVQQESVGASSTSPLPTRSRPDTAAPRVIGTGWTSVVGMQNVGSALTGQRRSASTASAELGAVMRAMRPVSGSFGSGRMLRTKLVSVLLLDDGRLFAGAVTPAVLEAAAG